MAHIDKAGYEELYAQSIADPDAFWAEHGKRIDWMTPYQNVSDVSYNKADLSIRWYHDGTLNAAANCLDRHFSKEVIRQRLFGKVMIHHNHVILPIANCMMRFANLPMC